MAQRRRNKNKWLWWGCGLVFVVIVIAIVVGVVIIQKGSDGDEGESNNTSEAERVKVEENDESWSAEVVPDEDVINEQGEKQKVVQYEGGDPNNSDELTGVVTYAGVVDGVLVIRTSIDQYLTDGTCELVLKRGGSVIYSDEANIVGDVSTAICQGFDVPAAAGLGSGSVEINIDLNAAGRTGVIRGEVDI